MVLATASIPSFAQETKGEGAMGVMIVYLEVKDYDAWRPIFDDNAPYRRAASLSNERIFRSVDDVHRLVILMDAEDLDKAREYAASPHLKEALAEAGVTRAPTNYFVESGR
jgi:hypothetical protein